MYFSLIISTLAWGIAEIFYKKGNLEHEKYSHLKTTVFVGFFFGLYSLIMLFVGKIDLKAFPINFLYYLPVAICYIVSMTCSYFGVRFIEESIADPIENTSIAFVPVLCALFLHEKFSWQVIVAIAIVAMGLICISFFDKNGNEKREKKLGKKLGIIALCMPFCYMIFDAVGTFLDIFYTKSVDSTILRNVTEGNIENTANVCYELTFFLVAIGILIFLKAKHVKIFSTNESDSTLSFSQKISCQKWKLLAALFETIGQATYLFALSSGGGVAAVILGAGTVIVSLILSRIFLKEKLSMQQYIFVGILLTGIILLSLLGL